MKNASGKTFNHNALTAFQFGPEHYDPKTTKPLVCVMGMVDENGNTLPPFLATCNTLISMAKGAEMALEIWRTQGPETEGAA